MNEDMSKALRTILFLLFLLAFLVSAPLVVLYTAGFRFDLDNSRIVHTAVLNISSIPRNATIFIDGKEMSDRTLAVIENMIPGEHDIRLEKTGYLPWSQTITFKSRQATFASDIVLFLDTSTALMESVNMIETSVSPDGSRLAYMTQASSWLEVWTTTGKTESTKLLMRLPYSPLSSHTLSWSLNDTYLLLSQSKGVSQEIAIARVDDGSAVTFADEVANIDTLWWDASRDDVLYVTTPEKILRLSLVSDETETLNKEAVRVQSYGERDVMITISNNRTVLSFVEDGTASILTYLPLGSYEFVRGPAGLVSLYEQNRHRLILLDPNNREQPIILNEEVTQWSWNTAGDQLLSTSGYDLKRYLRYENKTETLTRLSEPIDRLAWYPRGTVALYQSGGDTIAMRLEDPSGPTQEILAQEIAGPFWLGDEGDLLYLVNETDGEDGIYERLLQQ